MRIIFLLLLPLFLLCACSATRSIDLSVQKTVLQDPVLQNAHVGIAIYEPATGRWWHNWQGDKYFVPASNIKIATCYAAMKYLGDSLVGMRYKVGVWDDGVQIDTAILIEPSGDPTFLHPDFKNQPVFTLLKSLPHNIRFLRPLYGHNYYGPGWSWSDSRESYMPQLSFFPIYGNQIRFEFKDGRLNNVIPSYFQKRGAIYFAGNAASPDVIRFLKRNVYEVTQTPGSAALSPSFEMPFLLEEENIPERLIADTLQKTVKRAFTEILLHRPFVSDAEIFMRRNTGLTTVYSQPTDSLLKPMMHRSDNFFAEQALLMVSNEVLGYMSNETLIDTLLKTDFNDLPQKPRWADGSGLSRYNLFTPQDFVAILQKMKTEFGMDRIRHIFAAGGEGTLSNFYKSDAPYFYGKTGTLSGVVALSGFLTTAKGKELIVSVLVNNHRSGAVQVRRVVEQFLQNVRSQH